MAGQKKNTTLRRVQLRLVRSAPAPESASNARHAGVVSRLRAPRVVVRAGLWATIATCIVAGARFCVGVFNHEPFRGDQSLSFVVAGACLVGLAVAFARSRLASYRARRPSLRLVRSPGGAPTPEPTHDHPTGVKRGA
jgi:hypothetical protein